MAMTYDEAMRKVEKMKARCAADPGELAKFNLVYNEIARLDKSAVQERVAKVRDTGVEEDWIWLLMAVIIRDNKQRIV